MNASVCIAGGGPAGMMLGYLLARGGIDVVVLEKHKDFLRDFRGDTIHPSTFELMYELGLLEKFLKLPHQELREVGARIDDFDAPIADLTHLPTRCKFVGLMPQWHFLNFLVAQGRAFPGFHVCMEHEVIGLIEEGGYVGGVRCKTPQGEVEINALLTVGADGRHSTVRGKAGFEVIDLGAPIDVLWMRLSRKPGDPEQTLGRVRTGKILVMLNRGDYWQCAYLIPKGAADEVRGKGLAAFREDLSHVAPFLADRTEELKSWNDVSLLSVAVNRLKRWAKAGLVCIGDAAHAMSPVGGVGINLAIQDAVAAANILSEPLRRGVVSPKVLGQIQERRELPARLTQRMQVIIHHQVLAPTLKSDRPIARLPLPFRMLRSFPALRRIPARAIGLGFRSEHVRAGRVV